MPGKRNNALLNAVIFIVLEIAAILMLCGTRSLQDIWLNRAAHRTLGFLWSGSENVKSYFGLRESNRILSEENIRLAEKLRELQGRQLALEGGRQRDPADAVDEGLRVLRLYGHHHPALTELLDDRHLALGEVADRAGAELPGGAGQGLPGCPLYTSPTPRDRG